jgi:hypothetical protein
MSVDDRMINIRVDQTLVRRGIDTSKITVSSAKGTVSIAGFLKGRSKTNDIKSSNDVKQIDHFLRRIPNVKGITWHLQNWRRDGTAWKKIHSPEEEGRPA